MSQPNAEEKPKREVIASIPFNGVDAFVAALSWIQTYPGQSNLTLQIPDPITSNEGSVELSKHTDIHYDIEKNPPKIIVSHRYIISVLGSSK